jgi:hypothetical protein
MESVDHVLKNNQNKCWDCGKEIIIEGDEIKNGYLLTYHTNDGDKQIFKCTDCYAKNPSLTHYQTCEVYSRVVGYLRPVQQWHRGKQEEFRERKEYKI